ncbi:MAG TPA: hypothetical protein VFU09_08010 [Candidatus Udaeobacter sp.]|nr:hypothetical protein [Candidatus Udaeobacter sp.]
MSSPPKKARGKLASKAARKLTASGHYGVLTVLANIFGAPVWFFEQRRWQLADWLDNERSTH